MATYLREASVTGLYGDRDLQVRIPPPTPSPSSTDPTASAKSTLLRLLLNLLTLNFASLARIPFSAASVTVRMDDADPARDVVVEVHRARDDWSLTVAIDGVAWPVEVFTAADERAFTAYLEEFLPELVLLPNGRWWDERTSSEFTLREVLTVVADRAPTGAAPRLGYDPALAEAMPAIDVEYIGADRLRNDLAPLLRRERDAFALSGESASGAGYPGAGGSTTALFRHRRALAQGIADARSEAATLARSLDQTFPSRLVADADPASALSDAELATAFAALDAEYQALARLGLVEAVGQSAPQLPARPPSGCGWRCHSGWPMPGPSSTRCGRSACGSSSSSASRGASSQTRSSRSTPPTASSSGRPAATSCRPRRFPAASSTSCSSSTA